MQLQRASFARLVNSHDWSIFSRVCARARTRTRRARTLKPDFAGALKQASSQQDFFKILDLLCFRLRYDGFRFYSILVSLHCYLLPCRPISTSAKQPFENLVEPDVFAVLLTFRLSQSSSSSRGNIRSNARIEAVAAHLSKILYRLIVSDKRQTTQQRNG